MNKSLLQGLFFAPSVVASSLKTAVFASKMLEELGYNVEPKYNAKRVDIVQNIEFNDPNKLIKFCKGIQMGSPVDSNALPEPWDMPGYDDKIIMAAGTFTQGSSIELSCDGPIRPPYIAYMQGGLTYEYGKIGVMHAINEIIDKQK
jgi:cystathionine beta-lyase family protein involved in aluminum resistance